MRIWLFCFAAFSASLSFSASPAQYYAWLASQGVDPYAAISSRAVELVDVDGRAVPVTWNVPVARPDESELPSLPDALSILAKTDAARPAKRQAAKSARLKGAEKQLVKFLRDEKAIAADAVFATPEQIDAMYADWEATLNDTQLEKKSIKYTRLLERVERAGGTEADAFYHE